MQDLSIASAPWMKREDAERLHRELAEGATSIAAPAGDSRPTAPVVDRSPGGQAQATAWDRLRGITAAHLSGSKRKRHE